MALVTEWLQHAIWLAAETMDLWHKPFLVLLMAFAIGCLLLAAAELNLFDSDKR
jgi:hypothetical protein